MNKNVINSFQFSIMIIMSMMASFLGISFFSIIKATGVDACWSVIIGGILGIFVLIGFILLFNYEPDLPLDKKVFKLFGEKIGVVINVIFWLIAFSMGLTAMFNLNNFITSQFLTETPTLLIGIIFSLLIIVINIKGIEVISRTCLILFVINIFLYILTVFGLAPKVDISNLKPFLEFGLSRPFNGAFYVLGFSIVPIFIFLMIPKNSLLDKEKVNKFLVGVYSLAVILMFFVLFFTLGNLGIYLTSIYQYPEYIVLKNIELFGFIDRIENLVTIQWIFGLFMNLSFIVFFLTNMIKNNNKSKLLTIFITTFILIISQIIFSNNTVFNNYTYRYSIFFRIIILIILTFMIMTVFYRKIVDSKKDKVKNKFPTYN